MDRSPWALSRRDEMLSTKFYSTARQIPIKKKAVGVLHGAALRRGRFWGIIRRARQIATRLAERNRTLD